MPANGRFDGHIVQGHVDGVGVVESVVYSREGGTVLTVQAPEQLRRTWSRKGR
jgi:riboflavin synthase